MAIDITPTTTTPSEPFRFPLSALRWSGIFAGLVVGIATNLFLLLLGAAAGLAVFDVGESAEGVPVAVAAWNAICMIAAAFAGGYVAARTAGLRRSGDGVLHGVVSWGLSMLLSAFFVTSLAGATLGTLFAATTPGQRSASAEVAGQLDEGNRQEAISVMSQRLGITTEQATRLVDQALVLSGREGSASPQGRADVERTVHTASVASGWLSGTILLSLFAGMGGGLLGAHGTRRQNRRVTVTTMSGVTTVDPTLGRPPTL